MPTENIVFTASNKNIKIDKNGYISGAVAAKNVTITATVADGSKVGAKLTKVTTRRLAQKQPPFKECVTAH